MRSFLFTCIAVAFLSRPILGQVPGSTSSTKIPIATSSTLGGIKPDGSTIVVNASTGVATAVGGVASAGGTNGQVQVNNSGALGGITISGDGTLNTTTGVLTISKVGGASFATVATSGSATDLTTGTLPAGRLPNPGASTLGGVRSLAAISHQFLIAISNSGVVAQAQPIDADIAFTDITTGNASTSAHGYLPKLSGVSTQYLDGTGNFSTPAGTGGSGVSPGGTAGQFQTNNGSGGFNGVSGSGSGSVVRDTGSTMNGYTLATNGVTTTTLAMSTTTISATLPREIRTLTSNETESFSGTLPEGFTKSVLYIASGGTWTVTFSTQVNGYGKGDIHSTGFTVAAGADVEVVYKGTAGGIPYAAVPASTIGTGSYVLSAGGLSVASGKTLTASNTLTLAGTDGATLNIGAGTVTLGSAAQKAASASGTTVASVSGSFTAGHVATYADTNGTIQDGGTLGTAAAKAASGSGGTVASTTGSFTIGHVATFADTNGTVQDGGTLGGGGNVSNSGTPSTGYFATWVTTTTVGGTLAAPAGPVVGTTDTQTLTNKAMVLAASPGTGTYQGQAISGMNAGATLTQWQAVYCGSSSTWLVADATTPTAAAVGLVTTAVTSGGAAVVLVNGIAQNSGWSWTVGGRVYLSSSGAMTQTAPSGAGNIIQVVGTAISATAVYICPVSSSVIVHS